VSRDSHPRVSTQASGRRKGTPGPPRTKRLKRRKEKGSKRLRTEAANEREAELEDRDADGDSPGQRDKQRADDAALDLHQGDLRW
jgi:hypothetical protein